MKILSTSDGPLSWGSPGSWGCHSWHISFERKSFCSEICKHVFNRAIFHTDSPFIDRIPDKMELNIDMFYFYMMCPQRCPPVKPNWRVDWRPTGIFGFHIELELQFVIDDSPESSSPGLFHACSAQNLAQWICFMLAQPRTQFNGPVLRLLSVITAEPARFQ